MKPVIFVVLTTLVASGVAQESLNVPENNCGHKCSSHAECPEESACISHKCADPCQGRCGANATCKVVKHMAACACLPGYTGNPSYKCHKNSGATCPGSWPPVSGGTKKFWVETIKKADWTEAVMFCMQKGQRLASILTQQELEDIKEAIKKTGIRGGQFWLAGNDHLYEGDWTWFTTNELISDIEDWGPTQPNSMDGDEDCLEYWERDQSQGYKWNDRLCHEKHTFICEYFE